MLKKNKHLCSTDQRKVAQWIIDHGFYAFGYDYLAKKWVGVSNTAYVTDKEKNDDRHNWQAAE